MTVRYGNQTLMASAGRLYEDMLYQFIQLNGIDCVYLPRTSESTSGYDPLFGDDPTKSYTGNTYTIECYVQSVDSFEGGELFGKFGLVVKKQARFLMANRAWMRETQGAFNRPREGDLLWLSNFQALFEIKFVNEEYFFYDFGKGAQRNTLVNGKPTTDFYGWSLIVEKFRYNDEVITSTNSDISNTVNTIAYVYNFNMSGTATANGSYQVGETVYQGANANSTNCTAVVVNWNQPTKVLQLKTIQGLFTPNVTAVGAVSHANWNVVSYDILDSVNHQISDNDDINTAANSVLNFTENNPFGEPT